MSLDNTIFCVRTIRTMESLHVSFAGFSMIGPSGQPQTWLLDTEDPQVSHILNESRHNGLVRIQRAYVWAGPFLQAMELDCARIQMFRLHYLRTFDDIEDELLFGDEIYRGRQFNIKSGRCYTEYLGVENLWGPRMEEVPVLIDWIRGGIPKDSLFMKCASPLANARQAAEIGWLPHPGMLPENADDADIQDMLMRLEPKEQRKMVTQ